MKFYFTHSEVVTYSLPIEADSLEEAEKKYENFDYDLDLEEEIDGDDWEFTGIYSENWKRLK